MFQVEHFDEDFLCGLFFFFLLHSLIEGSLPMTK